MNKFKKANNEIKNGKWLREENRGWELDGKTIGIIGYGNMGKSFAKKLRGFDCNVICYDILPDKGDENAKQVTVVDVLEYEKASFEDFFSDGQMPESFKYLLDADNVILTPHIAGWTLESKEKLAQIIVDKIISQFRN